MQNMDGFVVSNRSHKRSRRELPLNSTLNGPRFPNCRREAFTHFALRHDRIVQVIAWSTGGGRHSPCLVMERMDRTLYQFLGVTSARLDLAGCLALIVDICEVSVRRSQCSLEFPTNLNEFSAKPVTGKRRKLRDCHLRSGAR